MNKGIDTIKSVVLTPSEELANFCSPTNLKLSPQKLTFHRRIAKGSFGVVYLVTDQYGTKYAVKRSKKFGKKRSRELVNLGICNGARNVIKYYGSFYTLDPYGNCIQNCVLEYMPCNLRTCILLFKRKLSERMYNNDMVAKNVDTSYALTNDSLYSSDDYSTEDVINKFIEIARNVAIGINEIHQRGLIHRDLKPDNILIDTAINPNHIRICDLGSSKQFTRTFYVHDTGSDTSINNNNNGSGSKDAYPLNRKYSLANPFKTVSTPYICSRWYRAPELLFAFGCICAEILLLKPLFAPKQNHESIQVLKIIDILGTPNKNDSNKRMEVDVNTKAESCNSSNNPLENNIKENNRLRRLCEVTKLLLKWSPRERITH
nr:hypothetical protein MACL_00001020 [Theileria orientalis]